MQYLRPKWCHFYRVCAHSKSHVYILIFTCKWYQRFNAFWSSSTICTKNSNNITKFWHNTKCILHLRIPTQAYQLNCQLDVTENVSHLNQLFHDLITCCCLCVCVDVLKTKRDRKGNDDSPFVQLTRETFQKYLFSLNTCYIFAMTILLALGFIGCRKFLKLKQV